LAKQAIDTVKSLFSSGGRKFNGYGSFVQHIGDFGFRFDCVLTFGGSLQSLKVKKIFYTDNVHVYKKLVGLWKKLVFGRKNLRFVIIVKN
jgi:hypothetical protein